MLRQSNYIPIFRDNIVYPDNQNNDFVSRSRANTDNITFKRAQTTPESNNDN